MSKNLSDNEEKVKKRKVLWRGFGRKSCRKLIQVAEFLFKILNKRLWCQGLVCHSLNELIGRIPSSPPMDSIIQPIFQGQKISLAHILFKVGDIFLGLMKEHGSIEVPQCVRGKLAESAKGPMHILQHSFGIVGWGDP